jgi:hypothetical protein
MIHSNLRSDIFISISRACDGAVNKLPGFLFVATLTITLMLVPAAAQTPSFHGRGRHCHRRIRPKPAHEGFSVRAMGAVPRSPSRAVMGDLGSNADVDRVDSVFI